MKYNKTVTLKDGRACVIRNGTERDAAGVLDEFIATHAETDFLMTYPDESSFTVEQEGEFLKAKTDGEREIELVAEVDGKIVGAAGFEPIGKYEKLRHRASFGISVRKAFWRLGIGRALTESCIECAKAAGFTQLELDVVAENKNAAALYESVGFVEYGRNPKGFRLRNGGWQELVLMRLELI